MLDPDGSTLNTDEAFIIVCLHNRNLGFLCREIYSKANRSLRKVRELLGGC